MIETISKLEQLFRKRLKLFNSIPWIRNQQKSSCWEMVKKRNFRAFNWLRDL